MAIALAASDGTNWWCGDVEPSRAMRIGSRRDDEFEAFFLQQFDRIVQSVRFVCGDAERATDATQEAFIKAYARWGRLRNFDNPAAWVRRIAINASRDIHRSEARRTRREQQVAEHDDVVEPLHDDSGLDLLATLPERQRAVAALYYLDDLGTAEIAEVLGISDGTVRFHLSEARQRLRSVLGAEVGDDAGEHERDGEGEADHAAR